MKCAEEMSPQIFQQAYPRGKSCILSELYTKSVHTLYKIEIVVPIFQIPSTRHLHIFK